MWIKYVIPEDGDDIAHPNVFQLSASGEPTLSDLQRAFPVPGDYHFRVLKAVGNSTVWLDLSSPSAAVQPHQGSIFIKASRLLSSSSISPDNAPARSTGHSVADKPPPLPPKPSKPTQSAPAPQPAQPEVSEKLLSFHDDEALASATSASATQASAASPAPFFDTTDDLLSMSSTSTATGSAPKGNNNDLFGLETLQPTRGTGGVASAGAGAGAGMMAGGMGVGGPMG
eukprot:gene43872-53644_t